MHLTFSNKNLLEPLDYIEILSTCIIILIQNQTPVIIVIQAHNVMSRANLHLDSLIYGFLNKFTSYPHTVDIIPSHSLVSGFQFPQQSLTDCHDV